MLETLHIQNLALIERAEIVLGRGLNVLTGETGAGKSIIVDALGAISGARAPRDLVRAGAEAMTVTAQLSEVPALPWFAENGVEREDELILQRRVSADGKNVCRVNGVPVTVSQLRELGDKLFDLHGQNDGMKLLDERAHLRALDIFGGHALSLGDYAAAFAAWRENENMLAAIVTDEAERVRRADTLRAQIEEIESGALRPGEYAELEARRALLANASRLVGAFDGAFYALYGGEDTDGAAALLREAESFLEGAEEYGERFAALFARARDLRYNAEDLAEEVRDARRAMDFSPEELDALDTRMDAVRRLTRKYGGDEAAAIEWSENARRELSELELSDETRARLERSRAALLEVASVSARALTEARRAAADALRVRIEGELSQLAMPGVRFLVEFIPSAELTAHGAEDARFLMSANAGEAPGKVSRIASGGELARIMLALKNVLAEADPADVLVFDEVDSGVSGIAAQRVGEKLAALARRRQVLVVTHLPQIAALADEHFEISKGVHTAAGEPVRTTTQVSRLGGEGRVLELSRLIGGETVTETTKKSAAELIAAAEGYKRGLV